MYSHNRYSKINSQDTNQKQWCGSNQDQWTPHHHTYAYFLTNDSTPKGRDPNINIIDGIYKIEDRTSVNILVSNYTNKHLTFHEGEYIGHLEPAVLDSTDQKDIHHANSVTLKKMMSETITPDTFNPPQHELSAPIQDNLKLLLQEYESQFTKD